MEYKNLFSSSYFVNKNIIVTGGTGVLGSEMVCALTEVGANVAVFDLKTEFDAGMKNRLDNNSGRFTTIKTNVLDRDSVIASVENAISQLGKIDILINGAGGNHPKSTTSPDMPFFDIPIDAFNWVMNLNLAGTVLPSQIVGRYFVQQDRGDILNISSMNAFRPLTRIPAYSAAKAAVSNFTQWLAVHMAREYSPKIRVNAIAPGFFLTNQNRFLLTDEKSGDLTERGKSIIAHTPMGRFGNPGDLIGTLFWLLSPASEFVTGIVIPVDGGFSAYSGV